MLGLLDDDLPVGLVDVYGVLEPLVYLLRQADLLLGNHSRGVGFGHRALAPALGHRPQPRLGRDLQLGWRH